MLFLTVMLSLTFLAACQPPEKSVQVEQRRDHMSHEDEQPAETVVKKTTNQDVSFAPKDQFDESLRAIVEGVPSGEDRSEILSLAVKGVGVSQFLFKLGLSENVDCREQIGYTMQLNPVAPLALDLSTYAFGKMRLCVIAGSIDNFWQPYDKATIAEWTRIEPLASDRPGDSVSDEIRVSRPAVQQADNPNYCYFICMSGEYPKEPQDPFGYIKAGVVDEYDHSCLVPDPNLGKYSDIYCERPR